MHKKTLLLPNQLQTSVDLLTTKNTLGPMGLKYLHKVQDLAWINKSQFSGLAWKMIKNSDI